MKGFSEADAERLVKARGEGYRDARDLWRKSGLGRAALERLATADALRSLALDRRQGLWQLKALGEAPLPLFAVLGSADAPHPSPLPASGERGSLPHPPRKRPDNIASRRSRVPSPRLRGEGQGEGLAAALLPEMPLGEHVVEDYGTLGLTLKRHPLAFLRGELRRDGLVAARDLAILPVGKRIALAGLVLIRQRPGSANGVVFITLEDETGIANLIVWPATLERFRRAALGATLLYCRGRLQREESVIHVVAEDLRDWTARLDTLRHRGDGEKPLDGPDLATRPEPPGYGARALVVASRDFR